jgi:hypothetical protein
LTAPPRAIARWHEVVAARSVAGLEDLLAEDVVFQSPAVHTPQVGRAITLRYLTAALQVLNSDSFRYTGEWHGDTSAVLEFECTVDGLLVNGVDMIHWDAEGRIVRFKVMLRPGKALQAVMPRMAQELERLATGSSGR